MTTPPPVSELEFLRAVQNHAAFAEKLDCLGLASSSIRRYAEHVASRWLTLADAHLADAGKAVTANAPRSALSRAYYAVYNASKSVRYLNSGWVSLKGDDHKSASDLPGDFPDGQQWGVAITRLYENRLRADYDNWLTTDKEFSVTPSEALQQATLFLAEARSYLKAKYGVAI